MSEGLAQEIHRFGSFVFDPVRGSLTRGGALVKLRPKSFQVLNFLLRNQGRVISKQELLDAAWPDVAVTEDSLVQCLIDIRKALGEQGRGYIRTVPRRGYICDVPDAETEPATAQPASNSMRRLWAVATLAIASTIGGLWFASGYVRTPPAPVKTVLVTPFETIPPGDEDGWAGLGLTDLLITRLSGLSGIVVRPMSAAFRYLDHQVDPLDAGREQRVDYVLAGSLRRDQDEVRASVRLWSVPEGRVVWTNSFAEPETKMLELEDAVSARIAEALDVHLTTEQERRFSKRPTTNPEAAVLYQRGFHEREQGRRANLERAVKFFKAAIEADPAFAKAYVALAISYDDFSSPVADREEADRQINALLRKALDLDDDLADAHAVFGTMKAAGGDFAGAKAELSKALSLDPNSVITVMENQRFALALGDYDRAMELARRWCDLDPLSSRACHSIPVTHYSARRFDEAIEGFLRLAKADPGFAPARTGLSVAYIGKQDYAQAIAALEDVLRVERAPERIRFCLLAFAYARSGRTKEARAMLAEMELERERRSIPDQFFAAVYAGLGEQDLAFEALDRAYKDRPGQPLVKIDNPSIDVALEVLRDDPRYYDFARRKGFAVR